ncbi:MAG: ABC transporter substrate-binding protein [Alphaproteobacteria bacterium]|nr:ABC transporter substrate-binding protein [Alphaproteobacteria bacterium]
MASFSRRAIAVSGVVAAALLALSPVRAETPDPAVQQVQTFYDALLDTMKQAKELGIQGRYNKLKPVIQQTFDIPDMARLAVGAPWATMSPADQQAITTAFERLTIANYANNFNGYDGEKFVVEPAVTMRGADKVVQSKLVTKSQTVPFGYRMHLVGGTWKILDIYLNGYVSQLATQRSDFGATVQAGGAKALVKKLHALSDKLMKE